MRKDRGDGSDAAQAILECVGKLRRHRDGVNIRRPHDRVRRANRLLDIGQAEMRRAGLLVTATIRPSSARAALRFAPPMSQPTTLVIAPPARTTLTRFRFAV